MSDRCPVCQGPNDCLMAAGEADATGCWCSLIRVPLSVRERVPVALRNVACICPKCVAEPAGPDDGWPDLAKVATERLERVRADS